MIVEKLRERLRERETEKCVREREAEIEFVKTTINFHGTHYVWPIKRVLVGITLFF